MPMIDTHMILTLAGIALVGSLIGLDRTAAGQFPVPFVLDIPARRAKILAESNIGGPLPKGGRYAALKTGI